MYQLCAAIVPMQLVNDKYNDQHKEEIHAGGASQQSEACVVFSLSPSSFHVFIIEVAHGLPGPSCQQHHDFPRVR